MAKKHQKHTNLTRRKNGNFAPNEVSILGAKCSIISDLVHQVSQRLSQYKLAYFDASHAKDVEANRLSDFTFHHEGNLSITTSGPINEYAQRIQFSQFDYVFINGNHYAGEQQIVLLDPEKEASINKRINQISDVQFFVKLTEDIEPFESLQEKFSNCKEIPIYGIDEEEKIIEHVSKLLSKTIPSIKGLVLTGGKSTRMGRDKSQLEYYGQPQKEFVKDLLENQGFETFYSVRNVTSSAVEKSQLISEIPDTFFNLGPFGGICSAFQKDPNSAWFVLATDLPFVNKDLIQLLLEKRNPAKVATAVKGKGKQFPEPLITIYEPKAYPILLQYLAQGYSCPRKMLINSDVEIVEVEDDLIRNVNTPEEYEAVKKELV
ncbi:molybdenum cofactor guanylyltransferase [Pseudotenacibaculum sp. MALMAid0570]|uniref:molybdenum cofactor guanylyltransferase n=1 Tax=Pseudotenacibaculum sp. MALMAid0570 TaxID=3143938 RepID=UPI0032DEB9D6